MCRAAGGRGKPVFVRPRSWSLWSLLRSAADALRRRVGEAMQQFVEELARLHIEERQAK
jgi:hypothetical protein